MRVMVVGAGYVGLSTAVVLASKHDVTLVEINPEKIDKINSGQAPFFEKEMYPLLRGAVMNGKLKAVSPKHDVTQQDFVILCVGTPPQSDGSVNLEFLRSAVDTLDLEFDTLRDGHLVIAIRSTVPPGTTRRELLEPLSRHYSRDSFGVVFNPEFMRQGTAIEDILSPARLVVGASDSNTSDRYIQLFRSVLSNPNLEIHKMSIESAELCKYASNCFLATKVSYVNEITALAEMLPNVDVDDVMSGVVADTRINPSHLKPGLGFGGTCLPKDLSGLIDFGQKLGLPMDLLRAVDIVNQTTSNRLIALLNEEKEDIEGVKVAILGLTFKSGTDDTRSSQSLDLIRELVAAGAIVGAHDPMANESTIDPDVRGMFTRYNDVLDCTRDTYAVFLMTDWPIYKDMGIKRITSNMMRKVFIDGRRLFTDTAIPKDIEYKSIGAYNPAIHRLEEAHRSPQSE